MVQKGQETKENTGGNGQKKQPIPGEKIGKDGKTTPQLPQFMTGNQLGGLISTKEMPSALNMLAHPGDSPRHLAMRTIMGKKTDGRILATAIAYHLGQLREFKDAGEEGVILDMEAGWVSDAGIGRNQLTAAITGERSHEEAKAGLGNFLQRMAWGGSKNKDGQ